MVVKKTPQKPRRKVETKPRTMTTKEKTKTPSWNGRLAKRARAVYSRSRRRISSFLTRRPHRSFRRTRRRDYQRSLTLPGYISFTYMVWQQLKAHKNTFTLLVMLYAIVMFALGGITGQETYGQLSELVSSSGKEILTGAWGKLGEAGLLMASAFVGGSGSASADQQVYLGIAFIFVWLITVWLLREFIAGRSPRLRDALYNAGAPFLSTLAVVMIFLIQLLPLGFAALIYTALLSSGVASEGFGLMILYVFIALTAILTLYWVTSTCIALVIITLPGMYPMQAVRAAGDLVVGRRLRVLYRLLWLGLTIVLLWCVVMIPLVLLDSWLKDVWPLFTNVPMMPVMAGVMSAITLVWSSSYIYILYRKIVSDDAKPA